MQIPTIDPNIQLEFSLTGGEATSPAPAPACRPRPRVLRSLPTQLEFRPEVWVRDA